MELKMFKHDFKKYPELTNTELQSLRFSSPHAQIEEDFEAAVVKVHDGDTITLKTDFRDFNFPLRFLDINAPELNEPKGKESRDWLKRQILNKKVKIEINRKNRVDKYGRLLGRVIYNGISMNETAVMTGHATPFARRNEGKIESINKMFGEAAINGA
jgi:endonuclease YncB( thermonuclease family)